ncbi:gp58-like family protein [Liquorilactobacillus mali]|uniref:beta strand repeat-containing protein n=1 Tax=Liquorilactobacillus mali TaxID=1618 RepID=UPI00264DE529|nr:gp58-like family protein [Liquorilactobacillus mali]MDN7145261.1 gp58-like family protein [Liquorilactobacillus mali]
MADTTSIYTDPSNMDKANVQLCIWNGTKWVELSNGLTINTINANVSAIADKVAEAQQGIAQATTDAQNAVDTANNAITQSNVNSQDITTIKADVVTAQSDISSVSSDLDTTKTNLQTVSDLATQNGKDINTTNSTVSGIQTDLANTQGDVTELQTTATGLRTDVTNAQGDISSLKVTATGLEDNVSSLQSDNTTNKTNISSLQNTADGLTSTVASVQTQVNNSAVGTNMLLQGNFSQDNISSADGSTVKNYSGTTNGITYYWYSTPNFISVLPSTKYIVSLDSTQTSVVFEKSVFYDSSGKFISASGGSFTTPSNATQLKLCFKDTVGASEVLSTFGNKYKIKLEKGSVATDYLLNTSDNATVTALSSVKQEADSISSTVTNNKTSSDNQFSTINQTISGIQSTVSNKADSSIVTQLSSVVDSKVNTSDYQSEITQLSSDINLRVKSADLLSQINIESGNVLIQSNKIYLDASSVVFGGTAFITSAMISNISADDITTGTMTAGAINLGNGTFKVDTSGNLTANSATITGTITSSNATITGGTLKIGSNFAVSSTGVLTASGATINGSLNVNASGNLTTIDSNGFHNYDGDGNDIYIKNGYFESTMYDEAFNATTTIKVQEGQVVASYNDDSIAMIVGRTTSPGIQWNDSSVLESYLGIMTISAQNNVNVSVPNGNFEIVSGGLVADGAVHILKGLAIDGANTVGGGLTVTGQLYAKSAYSTTTSAGANVYITSGAQLARSTSATKYKLAIGDIPDLETQAQAFLAVKPQRWFDKAQSEAYADYLTNGIMPDTGLDLGSNYYVGYIAEDLQNMGLDRFIQYGADGQIEGIQYDRLSVLQHQLLKDAYNRLDSLETKLDLLIKNNNLK